MDLVSFTFIGKRTKIEVIQDHTKTITKLHKNGFLAGLVNSEPTIFEADDERAAAAYDWCQNSADFRDKYKENVVNFVFNTEG